MSRWLQFEIRGVKNAVIASIIADVISLVKRLPKVIFLNDVFEVLFI